MALPGNGIFVVKGEISIIMTAMKRGTRWTAHSYQDEDMDTLLRNFHDLKEILNKIGDLRLIEPDAFLSPFLEVIKSEDTTGPVTSLALSAVNKFLSYGLIDPILSSIPQTVHNIADAVTHARFVGTDQTSDGVVLIRILQVLRTLTLSPEGVMLTNESLCEIMLSCFRICFETRLNELLRRTAEHYLKDMVQLVFVRLPQFSEDVRTIGTKQFKMRTSVMEQTRSKRKNRHSFSKKKEKTIEKPSSNDDCKSQQSIMITQNPMPPTVCQQNIVDMQGSISQNVTVTDQVILPKYVNETSIENSESEVILVCTTEKSEDIDGQIDNLLGEPQVNKECRNEDDDQSVSISLPTSSVEVSETTTNVNIGSGDVMSSLESSQEYVNQRGIRFTPQITEELELVLQPYGLACVRELLRFLISLCNPHEKQNTEVMIHLGLTLLTVAFEVGADSIGKYNVLLTLVKDDLCRNLFSLINSERLAIFAADLQLSFLIFESLRTHLKFQLEHYLTKLIDIVVSENVKITYEHKELALDNILQLWRIPGFVNELYLNYDCDMYCTNLFEDLTKLLAKNAFSATSGVYHTHLLSLDALLTVIESIELHCNDENTHKDSILSANGKLDSLDNGLGRSSRLKLSENVPTRDVLNYIRSMKKWLPTGTEHFNHKPKKGIQFFQEHGVLKQEKDVQELAMFLRKNPGLDKKMIGEYVSNRSNLDILEAFVKTFDFSGVRIDEALRSFLESFRLPGEAPTISLILEHFAEHWHKSNNEPFADVDSAFTLAYAIIMLNVDQHNQNAKKQKEPMSAAAFKKNVSGVNGGSDFDEEMLDEIYNTIKNDEIVMPAEQTGLVKENYLWKVLLRKGASKDGTYHHVSSGTFDSYLFQLIYAPIVAALSFVYEKTDDQSIYKRVMKGFESCSFICAHFSMTNNLDTLISTLCKFTSLFGHRRLSNLTVQFGSNKKAQLALKSVFSMVHLHGNSVREGWKNVMDIILCLFSNGLLPKSYVEIEDFIEASRRVILSYEEPQNLQKQDTGLLSSLYSYMVSAENLSKVPTPEEQQYIDTAKESIKDCNLEQLITDSKFLHEEALSELVKTLIELSRGPDVQKSLGYNYNESVAVFFMEFLFIVVIQNRDRVITIWHPVRDHIYTLMMNASLFDYQILLDRSVIGLLRIAIRLMRNEEMCPVVIQSLRMLLLLKPNTIARISRQISFGLHELLSTSAQNIHTTTDWTIIFTLLECVGAGAQPPKPIADDGVQIDQGKLRMSSVDISSEKDENNCSCNRICPNPCTKSDGETQINSDDECVSTDRGYTSDSELTKSPRHNAQQRSQTPVLIQTSPVGTPNTGGWILVGHEGEIQPVVGRTLPPTQYGISLERHLGQRDAISLVKCCESLAFLIRDFAHITPYNFDVCVHCIRTFVEASLLETKKTRKTGSRESRNRKKIIQKKRTDFVKNKKSRPSSPEDDDDDDESEDDFPSGCHHLLLDLMHTLHTRTAKIFNWWAEEGGEIAQETSLWTQGWCPLLQGMARLCCDRREEVRVSAIAFLQRALLVHDLQTLTGSEWEQCFHRVLFPLLSYLLQQSVNDREPNAMAEFRNRAATVLSKVFLHHLTPLLSLPTFTNLWMIILDFMDKYMHADKSDVLLEAIPELLKNMLLVMNSAKVFDGPDGNKTTLWLLTWERIGKFLPHLKDELFKEITDESEETKKSYVNDILHPKAINPMQHNIETVTRSSIILQPPVSSQHPVSSHLFAHLGQMVSTPIGPVYQHDVPTTSMSTPTTPTDLPNNLPQQQATPNNMPIPIIPNSPTSQIMQPTLPTGMPYMSNLFTPTTSSPNTNIPNSPTHTFPVLYNNPQVVIPSTTATEVQPVSLYAEYMGNPYNNTNDPETIRQQVATESPIPAANNNEAVVGTRASNIMISSNDEMNSANNNFPSNNLFISSNYFTANTSNVSYNSIPMGSEILFGVDNTGLQQKINIPITDSKTTTDV